MSAELSRAVSHALRHEPWLYELELDEEGWVSVVALVEALRRERWPNLRYADLERMVANVAKQRHEIVGDRIRALYGHSLAGRIKRTAAMPPSLLFHGTARETATIITTHGLLPMRRQFVHLSVDRETALAVGRRKAREPIILLIAADAAASAGVQFYKGNDKVWLADAIPARFVSNRSGRRGTT